MQTNVMWFITGDISATEEASGLATEGVEHRQRLQGGLLGDGANQKASPRTSYFDRHFGSSPIAALLAHVSLAVLVLVLMLYHGGLAEMPFAAQL